MTTKASNGDARLERTARLRWVPLGKTQVPLMAQRERVNRSRVDYLVANFDEEQIGFPTVNERAGVFYILDGMHRIEALKEFFGDGWESQQIQCQTYVDLTDEEMADRFDRLNDVLPVHALDRFRTRVNAGREVEGEITRILVANGAKISRSQIEGGISAVGTVVRVYLRAGGEVLGRTVRLILNTYGDAGLEAAVIDGFGFLIQRYGIDLDDTHASMRLAAATGGVSALLNKASVLRKQTGVSRGQCVAAAAVEIINAGKGGKKLPSWWKGDLAA